MNIYSHLIGNSRTENPPFRKAPLDQSFKYDSEDGVLLYFSDTFANAQFTAEDGIILKYTKWWPKWDKVREAFEDLGDDLTEDGLVLGFPSWWHGYFPIPAVEESEEETPARASTAGYLVDVDGQFILDVDGERIEEV